MELFKAIRAASAGMHGQTVRLRVVAENLAKAQSTATGPGGEPYQRKLVTFRNQFDREMGVETVRVDKVERDPSEFELRYDPGNPAANTDGYVQMPNVKPMIELMDMREAQRTYEANMNAMSAARQMLMRTIELIKSGG
jgi:flagellar basal-body rod protein FlgC